MEESRSIADTVDYKGSPVDKSKTGGWVPAALILGLTEICERLTTMGIAVNLVTYLGGTMHLPSATSANIVTDFLGTSFLLCLLGGFLADSYLRRYRTILIFALIQGLGTAVLSISTKLPQLRPPPCNNTISPEKCEKANGYQMGVLYLSLYLIALGTGGLKSCVSGFGTDQFDEKDEKEKVQMDHFFQRLFFFVSLGTLTAVTVLVYIQDEVGRSWAYGICTVSILIAVSIFVSGTKRYRYKKITGSPAVQIFQVIAASVKKRKLEFPSSIELAYEDSSEDRRLQRTDQFRFLDKASIIAGDNEKPKHLPPNPWRLCSVTKVEEVKMMIRLLPIWATTIFFWTTYGQMMTFSVEKAATMHRSIGNFQIPAGSLTVIFVAAILITIAVYDQLVMPLWKKWKGTQGFTDLQRIGLGLMLSTLGMAFAAIFEVKRLSVAKHAGDHVSAKSTLPASAFILIPQFVFVGSGEAFIYTGQLDFFITRSPKGMKSISTGLFLTTLSLGFFGSSFLVSVLKKITGRNGGWLADNINDARLDCFYGLLAVLSFINFGLFIWSAVWYKRNEPSKNSSVEMERIKTVGTAEIRSEHRYVLEQL
ncbi:protein NRT1/ PTR FAMILY 6.2-like [Papaver somniferum]|uniref:protein NRT1/ PTR FAMILY 6.2-like n=1 Tax=Papaver somniferum TaxID=3469 RepID=UPI000E6FDB90|nr:protein NRT1/ PTR FAMILY 6.2-like [Papaver somniferum]